MGILNKGILVVVITYNEILFVGSTTMESLMLMMVMMMMIITLKSGRIHILEIRNEECTKRFPQVDPKNTDFNMSGSHQ